GDWYRIADERIQAVQIGLAGQIRHMHTASDIEGPNIEELRFLPKAKNEVRSGAVTSTGGGTYSPDAQDPNRLSSDQCEMRVTMLNPLMKTRSGLERRFMPGQKAYFRVKLDDEPLALQWWRSFLQLIQTQRTARSIPQQ